jgi:hypothetical protein
MVSFMVAIPLDKKILSPGGSPDASHLGLIQFSWLAGCQAPKTGTWPEANDAGNYEAKRINRRRITLRLARRGA